VCYILFIITREYDDVKKEGGGFCQPPFSYDYAAIPNDFSKIFGSYEISTILFGSA
jgi:hypothetical protein